MKPNFAYVLSPLLALSFCLKVMALNSDFEQGTKLCKTGQFQKALSYLDKSVDTEPTNGDFHFWRAQCLKALHKNTDACAEYKLAALLSTDSTIKDACKVELARFKQVVPSGSLNSTPNANASGNLTSGGSKGKDDKFFKLSSKKLEWGLEMRKDFLQNMQTKTDRLDLLAKGDRWQLPAGLAVQGNPNFQATLNGGPAHFTTALSADERQALLRSDVVVVLDHSGSMQTADCPRDGGGAESRLNWVVEEMHNFASNLCSAFPHGFTLITFDNHPDVCQIPNTNTLEDVLTNLKGGSGTDLNAALRESLRVHSSHPNQPLLVAVVTDAETDLLSCEKTIVSATHQYPLPNGVFITLLQVGINAELRTSGQIHALDKLKDRSGASYDAFIGVPFSELRQQGFGRELLLGLQRNVYSNSQVAAGSSASTGLSPAAPLSTNTQQFPSSLSRQLQMPSRSTASLKSNPKLEPGYWEKISRYKQERKRQEAKKAKTAHKENEKEPKATMWQNGSIK